MRIISVVRQPVSGGELPLSRLLLPLPLATAFRHLCRHLRRRQEDVFSEMIDLFVREKTTLETVWQDIPEGDPRQTTLFETLPKDDDTPAIMFNDPGPVEPSHE